MTASRLFYSSPKLRLDTYGTAPTPRELDALVAAVRWSTTKAAAHSLGIARPTLTHLLSRLYVRLGVTSRIEAVVMLWPLMADRFELP